MRVKYPGPSGSGVDVIHPDPESPDANTVTHCLPGEPVDLPDDVALAQMAGGVFEPADTKAERALAKHQREAATADPVEDQAPANEAPATDETPAEPTTQED